MILFVHLLCGAAIAVLVKPLWLALILAFLSHYVLDALPHWEYSVALIEEKVWNKSLRDFLKVLLDISLGYLVLFSLGRDASGILLAAFAAIVPDGLTFLNIVGDGKILSWLQEAHEKIHYSKKTAPFWRYFFPLLIILAAVAVLAAR